MASIEREVERGLINAISGVSGLNYYTSERESPRELPFVAVKAGIGSEELGPFTGVFRLGATITYRQRADAVTKGSFDSKFQEVVAQLYRSPSLAADMTSSTNITVYNAKVTNEIPEIISANRTWSRDVTLDIMASAKK